jgi:hypothetical protein
LDLDSEVAQHLQRLSRKDPTTKVMASLIIQSTTRAVLDCDLFVSTLLQIKALASLSELVKQKQGKELLPIIPQWVMFRQKKNCSFRSCIRLDVEDRLISIGNMTLTDRITSN